MTKTTASPDLSEIHKRAVATREAAEKAAADLQAAEAAAAQAQAEANARAAQRAVEYRDRLTATYPKRRSDALDRQAKARAAFEDVIAGEVQGNPFAAYRELIKAEAAVWAIETELAEARYRTGAVYRDPTYLTMDFAADVRQIIDHLAATAQDEETEKLRTRRARFMAGDDDAIKDGAK